MPARLDEFLRDRALLPEPAPRLRPRERLLELADGRAELDLPSPATEAWLDHHRQLGDSCGKGRREESRLRVRQPGEPENAGGQQLVVCDDERSRRIEQLDAFCCEVLQLAGAAYDAVELLADVQPRERDVPGAEHRERAVRLHDIRVKAAPAGRRDEGEVRGAAPVSDDGELHA